MAAKLPVQGQPERARALRTREEKVLRKDVIAAFRCLKGAYRKAGDELFIRACSDSTRKYSFKQVDLDYSEEILYCESHETLKQVA